MAISNEAEAARIIQLTFLYLTGGAGEPEQAELAAWRSQSPANENLFLELTDPVNRQQALEKLFGYDTESALRRVRNPVQPRDSRLRTLTLRWAAAILLLTTIAGFYVMYNRTADRPVTIDPSGVLPGSNQAMLTLPDGSQVHLSGDHDGIIVGDDEIRYADGTAVFSPEVRKSGSPVNDLQLTTPKGGAYQVMLPDGSKVWLNAASTLTYPSRFTADTRDIRISGEAYLEVTADPRRPFRVILEKQVVHVLGTSFQVTDYPDEPDVRTTLVSGAVKVLSFTSQPYSEHQRPDQVIRLSPGEQSVLSTSGSLTKQPADLANELAWHNDQFIFDNEPLESILRKVSRWYDVQVRFDYPEARNMTFFGKISRNTPLSSVLNIIEMTDKVHFTLEDPSGNSKERRLIVRQ